MSVADAVELFGLFLLVSVIGFCWGRFEREADQFLEEAMK